MLMSPLSRRWLSLLACLGLALLAARLGGVAAVTIPQTSQSVVPARASTSAFQTVTATTNGFTLATPGQAGAADLTITPSATNAAAALAHAQTVLANANLYSTKFESTNAGNSIPAGTVTARWTVNGIEQVATLSVTATAVSAGNKGGFTLLLPGDQVNKPANIRVTYGP